VTETHQYPFYPLVSRKLIGPTPRCARPFPYESSSLLYCSITIIFPERCRIFICVICSSSVPKYLSVARLSAQREAPTAFVFWAFEFYMLPSPHPPPPNLRHRHCFSFFPVRVLSSSLIYAPKRFFSFTPMRFSTETFFSPPFTINSGRTPLGSARCAPFFPLLPPVAASSFTSRVFSFFFFFLTLHLAIRLVHQGISPPLHQCSGDVFSVCPVVFNFRRFSFAVALVSFPRC